MAQFPTFSDVYCVKKKKEESKMIAEGTLSNFNNEDKTAFRKYDQGKLRYDLMPAKVLEQVVDVLTYGANKYTTENSDGANNWHKCPDPDTRYYSAALRHIQAYKMGEFLDKESGKPHLAHAICCLTFILEFHNMKDKQQEMK